MKMARLHMLIMLFSFFARVDAFGQYQLSGTIRGEDQNPIQEASIFINNTSYGTESLNDGTYSLQVEKGHYEIVVYHHGFEAVSYSIMVDQPYEIDFNLKPLTVELEDQVVEASRDKRWYRNLGLFKRSFLGESYNGLSCEILNEHKMILDRKQQTNTLKGWANEPLVIRNERLGYEITYVLKSFKADGSTYSYLGYAQYRDIPSLELKRKHFRARKRAYLGSDSHFFRELYNGNAKEAGYSLSSTDTVDWIEKPVEFEDLIVRREDGVYLKGHGKFKLTYRKERPSWAYIRSTYIRPPRLLPLVQESEIEFVGSEVRLLPSGKIDPPLGIVFGGYMGWEGIGDTLPLDYQPDYN